MSGINLLDMIMQAGGGQAPRTVASQVGLDENQTQKAIQALLPAISSALKMQTRDPDRLQGLLGALQKSRNDRYLDNPQELAHPDAINNGNAILGHLFGSKDVSRAVASHAEKQTGIGADILKKMLPMVATMAMGSLTKQTREPSVAEQLAGLMAGGGRPQASGGLGGLLGGLLGGGRRQQQRVQQQAQGLLGRMLDADGDGSAMDDVLGMAMRQFMKR